MSVTPEAIEARRAQLALGRGRGAGRGCLAWVFLFGLVMVIPFVAVLTVVWPGVLKLTAPLVCAEGFDDTVVARDTTHTAPGETSTSFTLYCMNERGELSDEGGFRPAALVFVGCAALYLVVAAVMMLAVSRRGRRRRRGDPGQPGPTEVSWLVAPPGTTIRPAPGAPPVPPRSSPIPPPPPG